MALPLALPPTVPAGAALHLPTLRAAGGRVLADVAFTHPVPQAQRTGHTVALGIDWGLNTLRAPRGALLYRPYNGQRREEISLDLMPHRSPKGPMGKQHGRKLAVAPRY